MNDSALAPPGATMRAAAQSVARAARTNTRHATRGRHGVRTFASAAPVAAAPATATATTPPSTRLPATSPAPLSSSVSSFAAPSTPASAASSTSALYSSLLSRLLVINRDRRVRLGISTTRRLLAAAGPGFDLSGIPVIHVAGSNGKGSTVLKVARALQMHGLRVGVYTSPHISSFRERVTINDELMSEEDFCTLLPPLLALASDEKADLPATFFELGTALAFGYFVQQRVDVAVVEVGLGGRLDSTNVLDPEIAVIASIALEHTEWLGDTRELIAREKAGILKARRPVLIGPSVPLEVVSQVAAEVGAGPLEQLQWRPEFVDYDAENSALASRALQIVSESSPRIRNLLAQHSPSSAAGGGLDEDIVRRAVRARPPCRFQRVAWDTNTRKGTYIDEEEAGESAAASATIAAESSSPSSSASSASSVVPAASSSLAAPTIAASPAIEAVMDVCHNPAAFARLFDKLALQYGARHDPAANSSSTVPADSFSPAASMATAPLDIFAVVGFSSDKDYVSCLRLLMSRCRRVWIAQGDTPRAARADDVWRAAVDNGLVEEFPDCTLAVHDASPFNTLQHALDVAASSLTSSASSASSSLRVASPSLSPSVAPRSPVILCCGTFFIMSDVRRALQLPHPTDPVAVNEQSLKAK